MCLKIRFLKCCGNIGCTSLRHPEGVNLWPCKPFNVLGNDAACAAGRKSIKYWSEESEYCPECEKTKPGVCMMNVVRRDKLLNGWESKTILTGAIAKLEGGYKEGQGAQLRVEEMCRLGDLMAAEEAMY